MSDPTPLSTPSPEVIAAATLTRYADWLCASRGLALDDYEALRRWSVDELEDFWASVVEYFQIDLGNAPGEVLADSAMPGARWFPTARTSYPERIFSDRSDDAVAIRHTSEVRPELGHWTWGRLGSETARIAAGLRALGVGEGDRVCAYMPNIPETVAAFLATASLGAVWSSAAPEFGARSVIDRFAQVQPKVIMAIDGYRYGGRDFDRGGEVAQIAAEIPEARWCASATSTTAAGRTGSSGPRPAS